MPQAGSDVPPQRRSAAESTQLWPALLEAVVDGEQRLFLQSASGRRAVLMAESELLRLEAGARNAGHAEVLLTKREREILELVGEGSSGAVIAGQLGVATNTVAQHLMAARRKLGVRSSSEAVAAARAAGLIDPASPSSSSPPSSSSQD